MANTLAIDPSSPQIMYAGTADGNSQTVSGVFKSTDGGRNWTAQKKGLTGIAVIALAIDPLSPQSLYVISNGMSNDWGVFKSSDGAGSWTALKKGLPEVPVQNPVDPSTWPVFTHLALAPSSSQTVYVGTVRAGVFKSTDGGNSWTAAANKGLPEESARAWAIDPSLLRPPSDRANVRGGFMAVEALAADPSSPSTVYVGTGLAGVFKSTDGGSNWTAVNKGLPWQRR
jgi:photosystem II stability/assembly factor-like uncharacterized protein